MKVEEACGCLKTWELLMERKILGNMFKLWKRKEARCFRFRRDHRKRQDRHFGRD